MLNPKKTCVTRLDKIKTKFCGCAIYSIRCLRPPSLFPTKVRTCRFQDTVTPVFIAPPGRCLLIRKTRVTPLKKSRSLFQRLGIKSPVVRQRHYYRWLYSNSNKLFLPTDGLNSSGMLFSGLIMVTRNRYVGLFITSSAGGLTYWAAFSLTAQISCLACYHVLSKFHV